MKIIQMTDAIMVENSTRGSFDQLLSSCFVNNLIDDDVKMDTNLDSLSQKQASVDELVMALQQKLKEATAAKELIDKHKEMTEARLSPLIALDSDLVQHIMTFLDIQSLAALDSGNKWLHDEAKPQWEARKPSIFVGVFPDNPHFVYSWMHANGPEDTPCPARTPARRVLRPAQQQHYDPTKYPASANVGKELLFVRINHHNKKQHERQQHQTPEDEGAAIWRGCFYCGGSASTDMVHLTVHHDRPVDFGIRPTTTASSTVDRNDVSAMDDRFYISPTDTTSYSVGQPLQEFLSNARTTVVHTRLGGVRSSETNASSHTGGEEDTHPGSIHSNLATNREQECAVVKSLLCCASAPATFQHIRWGNGHRWSVKVDFAKEPVEGSIEETNQLSLNFGIVQENDGIGHTYMRSMNIATIRTSVSFPLDHGQLGRSNSLRWV